MAACVIRIRTIAQFLVRLLFNISCAIEKVHKMLPKKRKFERGQQTISEMFAKKSTNVRADSAGVQESKHSSEFKLIMMHDARNYEIDWTICFSPDFHLFLDVNSCQIDSEDAVEIDSAAHAVGIESAAHAVENESDGHSLPTAAIQEGAQSSTTISSQAVSNEADDSGEDDTASTLDGIVRGQ